MEPNGFVDPPLASLEGHKIVFDGSCGLISAANQDQGQSNRNGTHG